MANSEMRLPEHADELVQRILAAAPGAVEALIEAAGHETDWLELKAAIYDPNPMQGENSADYHWNLAHAVIAMANTRGGVLILGVEDVRKEAVGLELSDPRKIIKSKGIETFIRDVIGQVLWPKQGGWATGKQGFLKPTSNLPSNCVESLAREYLNKEVIVIVVHSLPDNDELLMITSPDKKSEVLPIRVLGDVGRTRDLYTKADIESYRKRRNKLGIQITSTWPNSGAAGIRRLEGLTRNNLPGWKGEKNQLLIGREDQLNELTEAFHDPACSTVCVIADGGYGKSSLVTRWMEQIRDIDFPGAYLNVQTGFAYSFYKQGWEGQSAVSSVPFFEECLAALSGVERELLPGGGIEGWAREVLNILGRQRSLLLLDGLEPHQSPLGTESEGEIRDKTLKDFVKGIRLPAGGLCIITSRIMPAELKGPALDHRVRKIELNALSHEASVRVLKAGGVRDDHPDLSFWARESQGHPLLLALLAPAIESGNYDPRAFESHRVLTRNGQRDFPKTIRNVVWSRLKSLGSPAQSVLLSTSMFDRPVAYTDLRRLLLDREVIPMVTEPLLTRSKLLGRRIFSERLFMQGVERLQKAAMLTRSGSMQNPDSWTLEAHPLIQAGVRDELLENHKTEWRKANWTIYRSLVRSVKVKMPDTREELAQLYSAVPHGVNAGRGKTAGWMYAMRCLRGFRAYSTTAHGMILDDVAALSHYFEGDWRTLKEDIGLDKYAQTQAYVWSGTLLTAVNRWNEGRALMERGLKLAIETRNFTTASRTARNLGAGYEVAGELARAEEYARRSIELLERRRSLKIRMIDFRLVDLAFQRMASRATLGNLLHYQGRFNEAEESFRDAEMQQHGMTPYKTLRGEWCFRAAELMLDQCKFDDAEKLIHDAMIVHPDEPKGWNDGIFERPMVQLAFVRTRIRRADVRGELRDWGAVTTYAKDFARIGEDQELRMDWLVPLFKIALASIARLSNEPGAAILPIEEAENRVTRSGNRLFEADVRIEQALLCLATGNKEGAAVRIRQAEALALEIGYKCRFDEIRRISNLCGLGHQQR